MKHLCFLICLFGVLSLPRAQSQVITTYAGTGVAAFSGDGGPASAAQLNFPVGIALDYSGNLIVADDYNMRIRKITPAGIISTIAGTGIALPGFITEGTPATAADVGRPAYVAPDPAGNIYYRDEYDSRLFRINVSGIINIIAGSVSTTGYSGDGGPATAAILGLSLRGLATDAAGNMYVADWNNNRVRKVDAVTGIITTVAGNGTPAYSGDGGHATNASVRPRELWVDGAGNLYISDWNSYTVRRVDGSGIITTVAGTGTAGFSGDGGPATAARLFNPGQMVTDSAGNLFICDYGNKRIRMVSPAGFITTVAGNGVGADAGDGGPATACSFIAPRSIAIRQGCGERLYISDHNANKIREIVYYNALPAFTGGHTHHISLCPGSGPINLDTMLTIADGDSGQPETWGLAQSPAHGTAVAGYSATSTGGSIMPSGLTYTPAVGYSGTDTFKVRVIDCGNAPDTVTFYINIAPATDAGSMESADTVCVGDTIQFVYSVPGGVWSASNSNAIVSAGGAVIGMIPGKDTITYAVTDSCGTATLSKAIVIHHCYVGVKDPVSAHIEGLIVFPNVNAGQFAIQINTTGKEPALITITNVAGEKVKTLSITPNEETALQFDVPSGVYFLSAVTTHRSYNAKVVVVR